MDLVGAAGDWRADQFGQAEVAVHEGVTRVEWFFPEGTRQQGQAPIGRGVGGLAALQPGFAEQVDVVVEGDHRQRRQGAAGRFL